jgi:regulator of protease activity HflC (stomatin/prohibitin superfamily)
MPDDIRQSIWGIVGAYAVEASVVAAIAVAIALWHFSPALRHFLREHAPELAVGIFILIFVLTYYSRSIFYNVPAGHVGVLWKRFGGGTVLNCHNVPVSYTLLSSEGFLLAAGNEPPEKSFVCQTWGEGLHAIFPWDEFFIYDIRAQQITHSVDVLSADGLKMTADIAFQFQPTVSQIPIIHKFLGPDYDEKILSALVGAVARDVLSQNTPQQIFSARRTAIETQILNNVQGTLNEAYNQPGLTLNIAKILRVLIRTIILPPGVAEAIVRKNEQMQRNEAFDFTLLLASKEAERKRIEANGIRDFQNTVAAGITESYLRWRGIEATLELASSQNAKIVIIGAGKEGLPVILGNVDANAPSTTPPLVNLNAVNPIPQQPAETNPAAEHATPKTPATAEAAPTANPPPENPVAPIMQRVTSGPALAQPAPQAGEAKLPGGAAPAPISSLPQGPPPASVPANTGSLPR